MKILQIVIDLHHDILLHIVVIWKLRNFSLKTLMTKILDVMMDRHHFTLLQNKVIWKFANYL
jgi:hypothetical protein